MSSSRSRREVRFPRVNPARVAGIAGAALGVAAGAAGAQVEFRTLAVTGQAAPGSPAGVVFESLSSPRINEAGTIAFWARLGGPGPSDPKVSSIWSVLPGGSPVRVVAAGDTAPFDDAQQFMSTIDPAIDSKGGVTFLASFTDEPSPTHQTPAPAGIFAAAAGNLEDFGARDGAPNGLPAPQGTFAGIVAAAAGAPGSVAFSANGGRGVWSALSGSNPELIAARDTQAPGLPEGVQLLHIDAPWQDEGGSVLFRSTLRLMPTDNHGPAALWSDRAGALAALVVAGDAAPGGPAGATFADFGTRPALAGGRVFFSALLAGEEVTAENDTGLWTDRSGALDVLAREGDVVPGLTDVVYGSISPRPATNRRADAAFLAYLRGPSVTATNNSAIVRSMANGHTAVVAREGDQVPGMATGVRYAVFHEPAINERGQVAFVARLRGDDGTNVGPMNNVALFYTDPCRGVTPVVRTGTAFTVEVPGGSPAVRTIAEIIFDSEPAVTGRGQFNGDGTLVFTLRFTDGSSGVFSAGTFLSADINRDGVVNSMDVSAFLVLWVTSLTDGTLEGDFDMDGHVTATDVSAFLSTWLGTLGGGGC